MQGYKKSKTVAGKAIRDRYERSLSIYHRGVQVESAATRQEGMRISGKIGKSL